MVQNMALLQVRNCPDDLYEVLTVIAQSEHRSVAQQTVVLLKSAIGGQEQKRKYRQVLLDSLRLREPILAEGYPSPADLVREDRDR
jgi:plasmid stability protein